MDGRAVSKLIFFVSALVHEVLATDCERSRRDTKHFAATRTCVSQRDAELVESSQDAARLQVIFSEMAACKDDSQQRSWALHEDEAVITEYLQELISILVR